MLGGKYPNCTFSRFSCSVVSGTGKFLASICSFRVFKYLSSSSAEENRSFVASIMVKGRTIVNSTFVGRCAKSK